MNNWWLKIRLAYIYGLRYLFDTEYRRVVDRRIKNRKRADKRIEKLGRSGNRKYHNTNRRVRRRIFKERTEGWCMICHQTLPIHELTIDHIVKISEGGTNNKSNLQVLCVPCHTYKDNPPTTKAVPTFLPFKEAFERAQLR